ncbi:transposable element Tcb1 transposase [Trichonephila clavipes]|uniref:Transposable element Tcb1 transposase n=1 Tax=Trichonephila clavipes TaxID=2585209 RepID=A0A8X6SRA4_TRICX|nr:transposable element Tcb1 transposase [Trichonephila clavipes]
MTSSIPNNSHVALDDRRFKIWRKAGKALAPKNTIKTVKFGDGSVLVWGCTPAGGAGELAFIDGIMDKHVYLGILKNNLEKSASKLGLGSGFIFQQDRNPKHTAKIMQLYLLYHCRKQLYTPAQSPDLNVIENLRSLLEKAVHEHEITTKEVLKKVLSEEWAKLSVETTKTLVESIPEDYKLLFKQKVVQQNINFYDKRKLIKVYTYFCGVFPLVSDIFFVKNK